MCVKEAPFAESNLRRVQGKCMQQMVERLRHEEFLRLFVVHEPAIRAFVRRLVPSRVDADDILQEVAVVLWERFEDFRKEGDFRAWATGIARFKVLAWLRDRGRDRLVLAGDVVELIAESSTRDEARLERQRDALASCLMKLSAQDRDLVERAYQPSVKIQDVAEASGRTLRGFYQWLYRVRRLLLECVRRELDQGKLS